MSSQKQRQTFRVSGVDCAACAQSIESSLAGLEGVTACALNAQTGLLMVEGNVSAETIADRVRALGYDLHPASEPTSAATSSTGTLSFARYLLVRRETALAALGALLIVPALILGELLPLFGIAAYASIGEALALGALVTAGAPVARSGLRALWLNREITINLLMTIAASGALVIGAYSEAGLVMVLFAVGEALEGYTTQRARHAIESLMALAPDHVTVLRPCMDCREHLGKEGYSGGPCPFCGVEEHRVPINEVGVGERVVVRPGERIGLDGVIVEGITEVNQSAITGESLPVLKRPGDAVLAGSLNGPAAIVVEVTRVAAESTLARITRLIEQAQLSKAPLQKTVDRFARYYTPTVVGIAALVASVPPIFFGQPFWNTAEGTQGWLYRALELLVIACPCALVISTPVTLLSAMARAAQRGVLLKGSAAVEALGRVRVVAFDKTGTLTSGTPTVTHVRAVDCVNPQGWCERCEEVLALASAVEQRSEHPLARAVVSALHVPRYAPAESVVARIGEGIQGRVNGREVVVGSHALFDRLFPHSTAVCEEIQALAANGHTPLMVSVDGRYAGYIAVADTVRGSSRDALRALRAAGVQRLVMLTGDAAGTAQHIAQQIGEVDEVRAELLPEDKVNAVRQLRAQQPRGRYVAMVGDGINDAPALAAADVGIAMGGAGSAQAMEAADVVLMKDDLSQLPFAYRLSRAALHTVRLNIGISIGLKLIFFALALAGVGTLWLAVLADDGALLLVTLNGLRLLRYDEPRPSAA
ncbi:MAG: cation-translocating P-type ATPase [Thermoflexales bacterium]|nr:cation-translocating P-type ATPase [Thermoflexales bacterium]MDW8292296.1 cation-translocating P-type ATPase [Anaerolineae bacterium]